MSAAYSLAGLRQDLAVLPMNGVIARPIKCKVDLDTSSTLHSFRKDIQTVVAKMPGTYRTTTVDGMADDFTTAIRCVVIERVG